MYFLFDENEKKKKNPFSKWKIESECCIKTSAMFSTMT